MSWDKLAAAWPLLRDVLCVVVALGGLVYEATRPVKSPEMILAWVGLLGTPLFVRKDEKDRTDANGTPPGPQPHEADRR